MWNHLLRISFLHGGRVVRSQVPFLIRISYSSAVYCFHRGDLNASAKVWGSILSSSSLEWSPRAFFCSSWILPAWDMCLESKSRHLTDISFCHCLGFPLETLSWGSFYPCFMFFIWVLENPIWVMWRHPDNVIVLRTCYPVNFSSAGDRNTPFKTPAIRVEYAWSVSRFSTMIPCEGSIPINRDFTDRFPIFSNKFFVEAHSIRSQRYQIWIRLQDAFHSIHAFYTVAWNQISHVCSRKKNKSRLVPGRFHALDSASKKLGNLWWCSFFSHLPELSLVRLCYLCSGSAFKAMLEHAEFEIY